MPTMTANITLEQYAKIMQGMSKRGARKALGVAINMVGREAKEAAKGEYKSNELGEHVKLDAIGLTGGKNFARIRLKRANPVSVPKRKYNMGGTISGRYIGLTRAIVVKKGSGKSFETPAASLRNKGFAATVRSGWGNPVTGIFFRSPNAKTLYSLRDKKARTLPIEMWHRLIEMPKKSLVKVVGPVVDREFPAAIETAINWAFEKEGSNNRVLLDMDRSLDRAIFLKENTLRQSGKRVRSL